MKELLVKIPDFVEVNESDLRMILAADLYKAGTLSVGQAAEVAGVSTRTFIETAGRFGVSVLNYPPDDLQKDFSNA